MEKDLILRDLYYSPKTGYRSAQHLFELAQEEDSSITLDEVKTWLEKQVTYTKYKTFNNPHHFRVTFVRHLGEQVQMDLIILDKYKRNNEGFSYVLMAIEILSRFGFAVPMKRKDANHSIEAIQTLLDRFHLRFHEYPKLIQFDEGGEFLNRKVEDYLKRKEITYFSTQSKRKASIVERFNRTIKEKIVKMHSTSGNHDWVSPLQDIIQNYNSQKHRSIGMRPDEVNFENQFTVWGVDSLVLS